MLQWTLNFLNFLEFSERCDWRTAFITRLVLHVVCNIYESNDHSYHDTTGKLQHSLRTFNLQACEEFKLLKPLFNWYANLRKETLILKSIKTWNLGKTFDGGRSTRCIFGVRSNSERTPNEHSSNERQTWSRSSVKNRADCQAKAVLVIIRINLILLNESQQRIGGLEFRSEGVFLKS